MPSKKKYNSRFPPARIKKIMQKDEDVGKVAAAVPVIISRSLELFIESLIAKTAEITKARNAKTLSTTHIKQTIKSEKKFDFLHDLVANVPDHQAEEETEGSNSGLPNTEIKPKRTYKPRQPREGAGPGRRKKQETSGASGESTDEEETESEEETQAASSMLGSPPDNVSSPPGTAAYSLPGAPNQPPGALNQPQGILNQPPGALPHPMSDFNPHPVPVLEAHPVTQGLQAAPDAQGLNYNMNNNANMPLNLSLSGMTGSSGMSSPSKQAACSTATIPSPPMSFPGLSNFMNMASGSQVQNEDDDYDT